LQPQKGAKGAGKVFILSLVCIFAAVVFVDLP
jgi:hypothetical protein